jgi:hypothetical protein
VRRLILCLAFVLAACGGQPDTKIGLRLDDFPPGWTDYGTSKDDSTCASIKTARETATTYDRSPDFEKRGGLAARSSVLLYRDEAAARKAFAALTGEQTRACLAESLGAKGATRLEVAKVGDERGGLRATFPAAKGKPAGVFDLVFVRTGRGVAELIFARLAVPFDQRLRDALTTKVVARLRNP